MKALKALFLTCLLCAGSAFADARSFQSPSAVAPSHPSMYSFVDVYRLTVAGAMAAFPGADAAPDAMRVAAAQGQPGAEARFSVAISPRRDGWLLLLAGLALAGWVAHRRLVHTL